MSYGREDDEDLHECCAVDCAQAGTEFLIIKSWALNRYGGKDEKTGTHQFVTSGYYCKNHMAEKLESLTRRYRPSNDTGTTNVNLAATTPRQ
jgi:hypothetical protein